MGSLYGFPVWVRESSRMAGSEQWTPKWVGYLIAVAVLSAGWLVGGVALALRGTIPSQGEIGAMVTIPGVIAGIVRYGLKTNGNGDKKP